MTTYCTEPESQRGRLATRLEGIRLCTQKCQEDWRNACLLFLLFALIFFSFLSSPFIFHLPYTLLRLARVRFYTYTMRCNIITALLIASVAACKTVPPHAQLRAPLQSIDLICADKTKHSADARARELGQSHHLQQACRLP